MWAAFSRHFLSFFRHSTMVRSLVNQIPAFRSARSRWMCTTRVLVTYTVHPASAAHAEIESWGLVHETTTMVGHWMDGALSSDSAPSPPSPPTPRITVEHHMYAVIHRAFMISCHCSLHAVCLCNPETRASSASVQRERLLTSLLPIMCYWTS